MPERLLFAALLLILIAATGFVLRAAGNRRRAHITATVHAGSSTTGTPRLLLFTGPGCGACEEQKAILDDLSGSLERPVEIEIVDAAAESARARQFGVMMVPTTVIARPDGSIAHIASGVLRADRLLAHLEAAA